MLTKFVGGLTKLNQKIAHSHGSLLEYGFNRMYGVI